MRQLTLGFSPCPDDTFIFHALVNGLVNCPGFRFRERLEDVEKIHIERTLEETNWNLSKTARILDIDRTTLYNKIKRYGLREAAEK